MSCHGGLLGVVVALTLFAWRRGRNVADVYDFTAPLPALGLFFGRVGNFINSELWGKVTTVPWGFRVNGEVRHPSQLYEAGLEGLLLFVVLWWFTSRPRPRLAPSGLFLLFYGVARFLIEFVRVPDEHIGYLAGGWLTEGGALAADDPRRCPDAGVGVPRQATLGQLRRGACEARAMKQYLELVQRIRTEGVRKADRTGTGTLSLFGAQMRFDLGAGFPLLTTKKIHLPSVVYELLWFLRGETNVAWLREHGVTIWDEWADERGELGPVYGRQWRAWASADGRSIDQIAQAVEQLRRNPDSRRIIVSAWNVGELEQMHLMPCHMFFQLYVAAGRLSCQMYQRSADVFLGVPFNIASYALLTHLFAQQCDLIPGEFIWSGGDCHLYLNHLAQADLQLARTPLPPPRLVIKRRPPSMFEYRYEDFEFVNYQHHAPIRAPVAV